MRSSRKFCTLVLLLLFFSLAVYSSSPAAEPSKDPILRIETGMHTAPIRQIATDRENRFLVTASDDKTLRVWDMLTGALLKLIRPPIGDGHEGQLFSVALSPDGKTIACGGWAGYAWDRSQSVYLFDRERGALIKRITGLSEVIKHLAYSKEGRYLAACLGGSKGIRVYDTTRDYSPVLADTSYGGDSYGADFDSSGRLVTASYDGYVRLYDRDFRPLAKKKAHGGNKPYSVAFSPDGRQVAVGFDDSTEVDVLSGEELSHLYFPDTKGVNNDNISLVAFSLDGNTLYGKGTVIKNKQYFIRAWSSGGRGPYRGIMTGASNTIMQILPLSDGGVAFAAYDPAFGVIGRDGRRTIFRDPSIADFRRMFDGFLISPEGATIRIGYEFGDKSPAVFSIPERRLETNPADQTGLASPRTKSQGLCPYRLD